MLHLQRICFGIKTKIYFNWQEPLVSCFHFFNGRIMKIWSQRSKKGATAISATWYKGLHAPEPAMLFYSYTLSLRVFKSRIIIYSEIHLKLLLYLCSIFLSAFYFYFKTVVHSFLFVKSIASLVVRTAILEMIQILHSAPFLLLHFFPKNNCSSAISRSYI